MLDSCFDEFAKVTYICMYTNGIFHSINSIMNSDDILNAKVYQLHV